MGLFPPIEPNKKGFLPVSVEDQVYWEESGNPEGQPILFLHGGPGGGTEAKHRQYFNPEKWRIILMDQRGCGKSKPQGQLEGNQTQKLILDIEKLRRKLKIEKWTVTGGSWGSTLALYYAIQKIDHIEALYLRSIFLARKKDIDWTCAPGELSKTYPVEWKKLCETLGLSIDSLKVLETAATILSDEDNPKFEEVGLAWAAWEFVLYASNWHPDKVKTVQESEAPDDFKKYLCNLTRLETHYFKNNCFLESENYILDNIAVIRDSKISVNIMHGDADVITPLSQAEELAKALPEATLQVIKGAGHGASGDPMKSAVLKLFF